LLGKSYQPIFNSSSEQSGRNVMLESPVKGEGRERVLLGGERGREKVVLLSHQWGGRACPESWKGKSGALFLLSPRNNCPRGQVSTLLSYGWAPRPGSLGSWGASPLSYRRSNPFASSHQNRDKESRNNPYYPPSVRNEAEDRLLGEVPVVCLNSTIGRRLVSHLTVRG